MTWTASAISPSNGIPGGVVTGSSETRTRNGRGQLAIKHTQPDAQCSINFAVDCALADILHLFAEELYQENGHNIESDA